MTLRSAKRRRNLDLSPLFAALLLGLIGVAVIYSAVRSPDGSLDYAYHCRQLQWLGIGTIVALVVAAIPARTIEGATPLLYCGIVALLLAMLFMPGETAGTKRWLSLGPLSFQPSELAKIIVVFMLARALDDKRLNPNRPTVILWASALALLPMALIFKQPDLGSSLAIPPIVMAMLYWRGLSGVRLFLIAAPVLSAIIAFLYPPLLGQAAGWIHLLPWATLMLLVLAVTILARLGLARSLLSIAATIIAGLATPFLWEKLHAYQQQRIITFLQPEADPRGAGYQIIQSKVAIGSGGFWGKGYLHGTQSTLDFIPERHTDFIVAVLGEEWGLVGMLVVLGLFFFLIHKAIRFAHDTRHEFSALTAIGIATILTFHVLVNVGMATGIMPVTGLTLPLVSYGGSSLLTTMTMVGILIGIGMRRHAR